MQTFRKLPIIRPKINIINKSMMHLKDMGVNDRALALSFK
jgi:hypothetical protein